MFGGLPAGMIIDYAKSVGAYSQLSLDLECPPWIFVNPEYLTSVPRVVSYVTANGGNGGSYQTQDHPSFLATRAWLANNKYIKVVETYSNGDKVLKPFYFNNVYMERGEPFLCASAMTHKYSSKYNNGEPLPEPNYSDFPELYIDSSDEWW